MSEIQACTHPNAGVEPGDDPGVFPPSLLRRDDRVGPGLKLAMNVLSIKSYLSMGFIQYKMQAHQKSFAASQLSKRPPTGPPTPVTYPNLSRA